MARNKYPEETVNLILDVSVKLFLSKGYDNTSIQDIIDGLGGLSKGAIYHHFKSKESILIAVYERLSSETETTMNEIRDNKHLTGLEKLRQMFMSSLKNSDHRELIASTPNMLDNPQLLAIQMKSTIFDVAPNYIEPVIREGIQDGSIQSDYPEELAQLLMLLSNVWMNPLIYPLKEKEIASRMSFFHQLTRLLGLPILDDSLENRLLDINQLVKDKTEKKVP